MKSKIKNQTSASSVAKSKISFLLLTSYFLLLTSFSQITLNECFKKARENYPLIKQFELIETSKQFNIAATNKNWIPHVGLSGKASWQSDVTSFPDKYLQMLEQAGIKGVAFPQKDQYNLGINLTQTLWDGGAMATQKKLATENAEISKAQTEINLYALYSQVNQLYFNILSINEQLKQNQLFIEELERNYKIIESYVENGVALRTDLDNVKVNILDAKQRKTEMLAYQKAGAAVLSAFIAQSITNADELVRPELVEPKNEITNRPELNLFSAQNKLFETQSNMLYAKGMPRIALFANGVLGDPGLNMFNGGLTPYFIGGINLNWNFGGLYTMKDEKRNLKTSQQNVSVNKEVFLFNTTQKITQQNADIQRLKELLEQDDEIIVLRSQIKKTSAAKVEHGTMMVHDYLRDVTHESVARQTKVLHEINLLQSISQLNIESGAIKID